MTIRSTRLLSIAFFLLPASLVAYGCGTSTDPSVIPEDLDGSADGGSKSDASSTPDSGVTPTDAGTDANEADAALPATPCTVNQHVSAKTCVACDPGSTRAAGDNPAGSDTQCAATLCAVDEHVVSHACIACGAGSSNVAGDDATGADTNCDGALCPSNQHVVSNACVVCPAGMSNAAGDDASGADTSCDAILCVANAHVAVNVCVSCPAGTTNAAGDDASGADTNCDATLCAVDQRVSSNTCVACAPGSTNAAGDDASGADTNCDATLCAANQYVSNHACVACAAASVNDAGDDASGADTTCDLLESDICATAVEHESLTLQCPAAGSVITAVTFASYGTPQGTCGSFSVGSCHSATSSSVMTTACVGQPSCTVAAENVVFTDPCGGTVKILSAQVHCGSCGNGVKGGTEVCDDGVNDGLFCDATCSTAPVVGWVREHCGSTQPITDEIRGSECVNIVTTGASWLTMVSGVHATVYNTADCTGNSKVLTDMETNFCTTSYDQGGSLNDTVRSLRIERN